MGLAELAGHLEPLIAAMHGAARPSIATQVDATATLKWLIKSRQLARRRLGPATAYAPLFDLMLELALARVIGRRVAWNEMPHIMMMPQATAARRCQRLVAAGAIVRSPDAKDGRRVWVTLSEADFATVMAFIAELGAISSA